MLNDLDSTNEAPESVRAAWNMLCPACKHDHSLDITASVNVRLCPDGTDADASSDGGHEWDSSSTATCAACNWIGTVKDAESACKISAEMIEAGKVYIEVYPMVSEEEGARLTTDRHEPPEFYDVSLRPDDWEDNAGTPYGEWEGLSLAQASARVADLEAQYPSIAASWVTP